MAQLPSAFFSKNLSTDFPVKSILLPSTRKPSAEISSFIMWSSITLFFTADYFSSISTRDASSSGTSGFRNSSRNLVFL